MEGDLSRPRYPLGLTHMFLVPFGFTLRQDSAVEGSTDSFFKKALRLLLVLVHLFVNIFVFVTKDVQTTFAIALIDIGSIFLQFLAQVHLCLNVKGISEFIHQRQMITREESSRLFFLTIIWHSMLLFLFIFEFSLSLDSSSWLQILLFIITTMTDPFNTNIPLQLCCQYILWSRMAKELELIFKELTEGSIDSLPTRLKNLMQEQVEFWRLFSLPTTIWLLANLISGPLIYDFAVDIYLNWLIFWPFICNLLPALATVLLSESISSRRRAIKIKYAFRGNISRDLSDEMDKVLNCQFSLLGVFKLNRSFLYSYIMGLSGVSYRFYRIMRTYDP